MEDTIEAVTSELVELKTQLKEFTATKDDKTMGKMTASQTRDAAIKKAMDEEDVGKKDAGIKQAMVDYEANKESDPHDKSGEKQHVASILENDRQQYVNKIISANRMANNPNIADIETRLKTASIKDVINEWNILAPIFEASVLQKPVIPPYTFTAAEEKTQIDELQLNASSPNSDFSKIPSAKLMEMYK